MANGLIEVGDELCWTHVDGSVNRGRVVSAEPPQTLIVLWNNAWKEMVWKTPAELWPAGEPKRMAWRFDEPVFRTAGGGCMANEPAHWEVHASRGYRSVMGFGGTAEEAMSNAQEKVRNAEKGESP
jgi:hypothetical protein